MLRSCDEFRLWGLRYLKAWRQIVKFADTSVDSPIAGYNELCEMLFDLLSVNREDTLGQQRDETGAIDKLANILLSRLQPGEQQPVDPMEGMAVVDVQPGFVIPQAPVNQEAIDGLTGTSIPDVQTHTTTGNTPENFTPENDPASQPQGVINVGVKVTVIADGREGLVTWKGPNNKIKLAFEDGGTVTLDKDEVIANA
jgi:hypothetical protein